MSNTINVKVLNATERQCLRKLCALKYTQGESQAEIAKSLKITTATINRWVKKLEQVQGNVELMREKRRGTKAGTGGKHGVLRHKDQFSKRMNRIHSW